MTSDSPNRTTSCRLARCLTLCGVLLVAACSGEDDAPPGENPATGGQADPGAGGGDPGTGGVPDAGTGGEGPAGGSGGDSGTGGGGGVEACSSENEGAHFVDSTTGNDTNDGTSPETAWRSLDRLNMETFEPGDAICFSANGSWSGQFSPQGSGTSEAPISVYQYGEGSRPLIAAGPGDLQALLLFNVEYWEINDLELTNDQGGPGDFRGISVRGKDVGELNHIYIRNTYVHDVTGHVYWIGGDAADSDPPWITFKTGWDASKRTGGIVFEIESENGTKTWFNDVLIEDNVLQDTSFGGIIFKQFDGVYGWGVRGSENDPNFTPHTNIVVRGNYLSQTNTPYGCNTIYVTGAQHVLIEENVTKDAGTSAIEAYNAHDVVIQYNETYGTVKKAGGADSNGIDADRATTDTIIQYNYVHDNGDGILLAQFGFGDSIVRYNLIINNSRWGINLHSNDSATNLTYNNLFFIDGLNSGDLTGSSGSDSYLNDGSYILSNNIFSSTRASLVATGDGVTYTNNLFDGVTPTGEGAVNADPLFVDSSSWPDGDESGPALDGLEGFQLQEGSPARAAGVEIPNNGGFDFWGNPLFLGSPNIGPHE